MFHKMEFTSFFWTYHVTRGSGDIAFRRWVTSASTVDLSMYGSVTV